MQPAASGVVTRKLQAKRTVAGIQPAASGTLTRKLQAKRTIAGVQPSASGTLTAVLIGVKRTVAGVQPAATGSLTRKLIAFRAPTGVQPSASGALTRKLQAKRTVTGIQPAASGVVTAVVVAAGGFPPQLLDTIFLGDRRRRWQQKTLVLFQAQGVLTARGRPARTAPFVRSIVFTAEGKATATGWVLGVHRAIYAPLVVQSRMSARGYVRHVLTHQVEFRSTPYQDELEELLVLGVI